MHIPRTWVRAEAQVSTPDRGVFPLVAWGWGDDEETARREAEGRLGRVSERVRRGDPFPGPYEYGSRAIREEVLEVIGEAADPRAILTRNRYGATVLNAGRMLFLDVDLPEGSGEPGLLGKLLGLRSAEAKTIDKLRDVLGKAGKGEFRLYRTAAGFRALAPSREFDPTGREARDLMTATGTDRWFVRLCTAQKSFRARLTPKPWRMGLALPPGEHPREDAVAQERFAEWLAQYEQASRAHATCRFLESVGKGGVVDADHRDLVDLHDRATRAHENIPLA